MTKKRQKKGTRKNAPYDAFLPGENKKSYIKIYTATKKRSNPVDDRLQNNQLHAYIEKQKVESPCKRIMLKGWMLNDKIR